MEWTKLVLGLSVEKYLPENNLLMQALLVLDNARTHPPNLEDNTSQRDQVSLQWFFITYLSELFSDTCLTHLRLNSERKEEVDVLEQVFFKRPASESEKIDAKKVKNS